MNLPVDIGMKIQKLLEDYMRSDEFDFVIIGAGYGQRGWGDLVIL